MKRWVTGLIVAGAACVERASAQPTRRAAEDSQFGFFLERWNSDGQSRDSATGPFSKDDGHRDVLWFRRPKVICRETTGARQQRIGRDLHPPTTHRRRPRGLRHNNIGTVYSGTGIVDTAGVWRWDG